MDGTRYGSGCDRASFNLKNLAHADVCEIFLLYYVAVFIGASAEIHAVTEVPFCILCTIADVIARFAYTTSYVAGKVVNIVNYAVVIFAFISVGIVNIGGDLVTVFVITDISVVATVNIAAACAGCHSEHR